MKETPFTIVWEANNRCIKWQDNLVVIRSIDQISQLGIDELRTYKKETTIARDALHKLSNNVELSSESDYALRTADWLAGECQRQLKRLEIVSS